MKYASIIVFKKGGEFTDVLTYGIPSALEPECEPGQFVHIPFRNRLERGIIVAVTDQPSLDFSPEKLKSIESVISGFRLFAHQIELAHFIATYYHTHLTRALRLMIPKVIWEGRFKIPEQVSYSLIATEESLRGAKQIAVCDVLKAHSGYMPEFLLKQKVPGVTGTTLSTLVKRGVIQKAMKPAYLPYSQDSSISELLLKTLTPEQEEAFKTIQTAFKPVLLHGVTGSGKTEVYLRVILEAIEQGKQAILLVPEIALTPQMIDYFRGIFGERIALFHSHLSEGERATSWWKVYTGFSPLVIGSRSAIFAPVQNPGAVILDEEHEWTYKQESSPYYETFRVAEQLKAQQGCTLILGSATPRLESYYKAKQELYEYVLLNDRVQQTAMPIIHTVDLREEFKKKNFSIFSLLLQKKIKERLAAREQIILFVNQRGLARAVVCRDCGYTEVCPHCEISLKYHRFGGSGHVLICHYCGFKKDPPVTCPTCQSSYIKYMGVGTQRVEEEIKRLIPSARVIRADRDTTMTKNSFEKIYHSFLNHEYDVLIGTQMVAKGLHFLKVGLIGIILADVGLHIPDFRSHERLFQLITQVAGRCGRGEMAGEVVLQTYQPDHFAITHAARYEYNAFAEKELGYREELRYPPFSRLIKFTVVGSDLETLKRHIREEQEVLEDIFTLNNLAFKITSAPAMIPKMADRYYYHVLVRGKNPEIIFNHWHVPKGWRPDIDPIHTV